MREESGLLDMGVMTLRDALLSIDQFDEDASIYAAKPWGPTAATTIGVEGERSADVAICRERWRTSSRRLSRMIVAGSSGSGSRFARVGGASEAAVEAR
jgi:hypothetical protein